MKCPVCGADLIWQSSFMANECRDFYEDDDEAIVDIYVCSKCGREIEIADPMKEEREHQYAEYWGNGK